MFAVTGITGQVGGAVARTLLAAGQDVRAIVRDASKAQDWAARGAEIAVADFNEPESLAKAFADAEGVFIMIPANFAPEPGLPEVRAIIQSLSTALEAVKPGKVVVLSSIGAQHETGLGLIKQLYLLEQALDTLPVSLAFLRPGWFMENSLWDIPSAKDGTIASYLQPLDKPFPMVATENIGQVGATILQEEWSGKRIVEIEGPRRYAQNDIAGVFAELLHRPVQAVPVPRETWAETFEKQGTPARSTAPRVEMLDGFNAGWIDFEGNGSEHVQGETTLEHVLAARLK